MLTPQLAGGWQEEMGLVYPTGYKQLLAFPQLLFFKYPLGSQASRPRFLVLKLQGSLFTEAGQIGAF